MWTLFSDACLVWFLFVSNTCVVLGNQESIRCVSGGINVLLQHGKIHNVFYIDNIVHYLNTMPLPYMILALISIL